MKIQLVLELIIDIYKEPKQESKIEALGKRGSHAKAFERNLEKMFQLNNLFPQQVK